MGHPLAPVLSSEKTSPGESSFVWSNAWSHRCGGHGLRYAPRSSSVWLSCPAGTCQSPIRIKALGKVRDGPFPAPGAIFAPENRRYPTVSNPPATVSMTTAEQNPGLRPRRPRQPASGSRSRRTCSAMPVPHSVVPCPGRTLDLPDTVFVMQGRRRWRQSGPVARSQSRFRAHRPRPQRLLSFHPKAFVMSNATSSLIMW